VTRDSLSPNLNSHPNLGNKYNNGDNRDNNDKMATTRAGNSKGRAGEEERARDADAYRALGTFFFWTFLHYTNVFICISYYCLTTAMNDTTGRQKRGEGLETMQSRLDPQVHFFFCFFTRYTKVSIGISYYRSTTATNDATGGRKRGEGLETTQSRLKLVFRYVFYYFITCYTKVFIGISYYHSTTAMNHCLTGRMETRGGGRDNAKYIICILLN